MRIKIILPTLLTIFSVTVQSQNGSRSFFNEFGFSVNRTNVENDNTENRFGFGFGAYHLARNGKKLNLALGVEYNQTRQFKKSIYGGHYYSYSNITYSLNTLSIPASARLNLGNFFLEAGGCIEFYVAAKRRGTTHSYPPGQVSEVSDFKDIADITPLNYGPSAGLGFRLPLHSHEFFLKTTYRRGLKNLHNNNRFEIFNNTFR
jgi:hypothetical protein